MCIPDVAKNLNVKIFSLMSRTKELHETYKCKSRLDVDNKRCWNKDKCRCECKELIDKGICNKGFVWNPSNCECGCNK